MLEMEGKYMETKEGYWKFTSILTKVRDICGYDCVKCNVISDDPYCDVDYGGWKWFSDYWKWEI